MTHCPQLDMLSTHPHKHLCTVGFRDLVLEVHTCAEHFSSASRKACRFLVPMSGKLAVLLPTPWVHRGLCPGVPGLPVYLEKNQTPWETLSPVKANQAPESRIRCDFIRDVAGKENSLPSSSQVLPSFLLLLGHLCNKITIFKVQQHLSKFHFVLQPPPLPGSKRFPFEKTLYTSSPILSLPSFWHHHQPHAASLWLYLFQ